MDSKFPFFYHFFPIFVENMHLRTFCFSHTHTHARAHTDTPKKRSFQSVAFVCVTYPSTFVNGFVTYIRREKKGRKNTHKSKTLESRFKKKQTKTRTNRRTWRTSKTKTETTTTRNSLLGWRVGCCAFDYVDLKCHFRID